MYMCIFQIKILIESAAAVYIEIFICIHIILYALRLKCTYIKIASLIFAYVYNEFCLNCSINLRKQFIIYYSL